MRRGRRRRSRSHRKASTPGGLKKTYRSLIDWIKVFFKWRKDKRKRRRGAHLRKRYGRRRRYGRRKHPVEKDALRALRMATGDGHLNPKRRRKVVRRRHRARNPVSGTFLKEA